MFTIFLQPSLAAFIKLFGIFFFNFFLNFFICHNYNFFYLDTFKTKNT